MLKSEVPGLTWLPVYVKLAFAEDLAATVTSLIFAFPIVNLTVFVPV